MIPVALRLQNFLSYGTSAPTLDFEQFHVACLSGRNGQGKSALLDAITWALWGEARKSSGSHKPDEELLRIGTRDMQVELAFDLEGSRYRVTRAYHRSASGKTSRSELELHAMQNGSGDYVPLTGANQRETQGHLDRLLGLDYDTFINSAFLLQGRSDEFTKKGPSERKQILARILNLSRYDRLADLARERERVAADRLRVAEQEIERLKAVLEEEGAWKEEREAVAAQVKAEQERLDGLRAEERRLTEQLASLDALARQADDARRFIAGLAQQQAEGSREAGELGQHLEKAEALIAQKDEIERNHERFEALSKERNDLDHKRDLFRGVEKQRDQKQLELQQRRHEIESRIHLLDSTNQAEQRSLSDAEAKLIERPSVQRRLEKARAAKTRFDELHAVKERRRGMEEEIKNIESELLGQRKTLEARLDGLEKQIAESAGAAETLQKLEAHHQELKEAERRLAEKKEALTEARIAGQGVAETLREASGRLQAKQQEKEKLMAHLERVLSTTDSVCPTCGTTLTEAHRQEVATEYRVGIGAIDDDLEAGRAWMNEQKTQREEIAARYRALDSEVAGMKDVPEQLATVEEKIRQQREGQQVREEHKAQAEALRRTLEEKSYGADLRRSRQDLAARLAALPFDEAAYEQVRKEAEGVAFLQEKLNELEQAASRKEQLDKQIAQRRKEADALRKSLDDSTALGPIQQVIDRLGQQLEQIGFDPARFDAVRQELAALTDAGARLRNLVNAQQNHARWKEQLARVQQRLADAAQEQAKAQEKLAAMEKTLAARAAFKKEHEEKSAACRQAEQCVQALHTRHGELGARLEQARQDREALKAERKKHAEARAERSLYRHLKGAFGRHGIPSLIIEQTLPEIEDRANDLLARLTDGRMHVRLETLKDKKTGGTKETLEIKITDEQGASRPYETFSGGEAFRVNFALRIALAQLLAERSGVRIRTLVVDEGFGTQDAQGVQNMVEAIQAIQTDFDKIVVITHLDQLKEAFPVRIEVEKDPVDGSRFEVLGV